MMAARGKKALLFLMFKRRPANIVDYIYPLMKKLPVMSIIIAAAAITNTIVLEKT